MKSLKENFKMEEVLVSIRPSERPYLIFFQLYSVSYSPLSLKKVTIDVLIDIVFFFGDAMGPGRRNRCKQPTYVPPREF